MKSKLMGPFPAYALSAVLLVFECSCAIKYQASSTTRGQLKSWNIEAALEPGAGNLTALINGTNLVAQPYTVENNYDGSNSPLTSLHFRLYAKKQVRLLREQLLYSNRVRWVSITEK